jgi:hypothetical protein
MTPAKDINVYLDHDSGGWIREVRIFGRWVRVGVFGSRSAAMRA